MPKIDLASVQDEPTNADVVKILRGIADCMEQRFEEAAKERADITAQATEDREASK